MKMLSERALFAADVARAAGELVLGYYDRRMEPIWTGRSHFKTAADDASEALIRNLVNERYPEEDIWSEEGGRSGTGSRFRWIWDAVDGTIPMFMGITDHFSVCGAFCEGDTPILGAASAPKRKELYVGEIGHGAFCNDQPIHVSRETEIAHVVMGIDSGKDNRTAHVPFIQRAYAKDGITCMLMGGCASVPLLLVASGVMHAYLATSLSPEDMAAAVPIIREAGGKVTNLKGEEWTVKDPSILAANPALHAKLGKFFGIF